MVLPDYQGIGIGTTFIKRIAKMVSDRGFELNLTTTTPSLIYALKKDKQWALSRFGRTQGGYGYTVDIAKQLSNSLSKNRITFSFWFKD